MALNPAQERLLLATARTLRALLAAQMEADPLDYRLWPDRMEIGDLQDGLDDALAPYQPAHSGRIIESHDHD